MRPENLKLQVIARAMGMLYIKDGREYAKCVTIGKTEFSFEYSNPEEHARIEVDTDGSRSISYLPNDFDQFKLDYPNFF